MAERMNSQDYFLYLSASNSRAWKILLHSSAYTEEEVRKAQAHITTQIEFQTKYLNVWRDVDFEIYRNEEQILSEILMGTFHIRSEFNLPEEED